MAQTGRVLSFLRARPSPNDWTQQELAEFYRVESALLQGGLLVTTDRGVSDEGDPWFVFCRSDSEEVIAHFARIDGCYLVASTAFSGTARGRDFKLLVRELMDAHPLMLPRAHGGAQKVFLHPAALLAALLAASYLISSDKDAAVQDVSAAGHEKELGCWSYFRVQDFAILSAVAMAATWIESHIEPAFNLFQDLTPLADAGSNSALPADHAAHAVDAGVIGSAAQALHGDDIAAHRAAGDPMQSTASEPRADTTESGTLPTTAGHFTGVMTATGANSSDATAAFNDGKAAGDANGMKEGFAVALNDADALPGGVQLQALADHDPGGSARQAAEPGDAPAPSVVGSGSIAAPAIPASTMTDSVDYNQQSPNPATGITANPIAPSGTAIALGDIAATGGPTMSSASAEAAAAPTDASGQGAATPVAAVDSTQQSPGAATPTTTSAQNKLQPTQVFNIADYLDHLQNADSHQSHPAFQLPNPLSTSSPASADASAYTVAGGNASGAVALQALTETQATADTGVTHPIVGIASHPGASFV